ncbi:hypothetical protein AQS8620_03245 [Aquimixticola soesokkakensis]|uniref:Porin domain-containing protein n=2 Tax=Aquimixticola soesokkakensis TaxID=1519096 RepID=A0A1Y5TP96_9RHOB|nr:hypothetical protein AQS8620_03245 [Aquimixticola soesokkakensis]
MKKILLSTVALAAFAGAASAEISWTGTAKLGYNDDFNDGFFADADVDIKASQELDNGWTAALTYGLELEELRSNDRTQDGFSADNNIVVSLTSDYAGLYYGEVEYAAVSYWDGVSEMASDSFSEQDDEEVLKATMMYAGFEGGVSGMVLPTSGDINQVNAGVSGSIMNYGFSVAYQEAGDDVITAGDYAAGKVEDYDASEVFGISGSGSFAGADVTVAYAQNKTADTESYGVEVAYPVGPVVLGAFYVAEPDLSDDTYGVMADYEEGALAVSAYYQSVVGQDEYALEVSYDLGNGIKLAGGHINGDDSGDNDFGTYALVDYSLGGGASIVTSYVDADVEGTDDFDTGTGYELKDGATILVTLKF